MEREVLRCCSCKYWKMGIPVGRCLHPKAGFLVTSDVMVFEEAGKDCPLNKDGKVSHVIFTVTDKE